MALIAFPLQSNFTGYDGQGNPIYDRAVDSVFYRTFWKKYFTNGIFFEPATSFQVAAIGDMKLSVQLGECHIEGLTTSPDDTTEEILTLNQPSATVDRTDRIVIRADFENDRIVTIEVRENWQITDTLTRNSNTWELAVADVLVRKSAVSIQQADITDLRLNTELCGIVTEPITRTNTEEFFAQLQLIMETQEASWQNQTDRQETLWQSQTDRQETDFQQLYNDMQQTYQALETQSFTLINNNFDDWSVKRGCAFQTVFNLDGSITKAITVTATSFLLAEKLTVFNSDGSITVTIRFYPWETTEGDKTILTTDFEISKTTTFNEDGSITEVVN